MISMSESYEVDKIFLETETVTVTGLLESFNVEENVFTMKNITMFPVGDQCEGLQHFNLTEIKNIYTLKYSEDRRNITAEQTEYHSTPPQFQREPYEFFRTGPVGHLSAEEYETLIGMAQNTIFIDCISEDFDQAIKDINNQHIIGMDSKIANIDGDFIMSVLSVCTQTIVYHFDIKVLGISAFEKGLKTVLESNLWKVLHNCRFLSYCLYNKYSVDLKHVFDTQVGELTIQWNKTGEIPTNLCSLSDCVKKFLGIPPALVHFNQDDDRWNCRPLLQNLKYSAGRDVVFLIPLWERIRASMLSPLKQGIDSFLKIVRDESCDEDAQQHIGRNHLVPESFLELEYKPTQCAD